MTKNALALLCCLLAASCGSRDELVDATGKLRLRKQVPASELAAAAQANDDVDIVVGLDVPQQDLAQFVHEARATQRPRIIGIGDVRHDSIDALVVRELGAAAAIDLALLAANGVAIPTTAMPIGTRVLTAANESAGGAPFRAPADFILQLHRQQHGDALKPTAEATVRIAVLSTHWQEAWMPRAVAELTRAANAYPQLRLQRVDATKQAAWLRRRESAAPCDAVIVLSHDVSASRELLAACGDVPAVVMDPAEQVGHGTTCVGCSDETLGMAAAEAVRMLQADAATVLVATADERSRMTNDRFAAFCRALGLAKPE